ncbi:MAG TPA: WG repeat-containing protein [Candidatus Hydrogenedentes bacterium]|nr:WG repeat-containing protein [Candidatus Hydrogenedentota bacterium]
MKFSGISKKHKKVRFIIGVVLLLVILAGLDLYPMNPIAIDRTGKIVPMPTVTLSKAYIEAIRRIPHGKQLFPDYMHYSMDRNGNYKVAMLMWMDDRSNYEFKEGLNPICFLHSDVAYYIDKDGQIKFEICPAYSAGTFSEGLAAIATETRQVSSGGFSFKRWGYIDKTGAWVIPPQFDYARSFSEGLAAVEKDGKTGFIDKQGKFVLPAQYACASSFSEGLAAASLEGGKNKEDGKYRREKSGYIDHAGQWAIQPKFHMAREFSEGLASVRVNTDEGSKSGYIDKTGNMVIQHQCSSADEFSEGLAAASIGYRKSTRWGYIDKTGTFVIPPKYSAVTPFYGGTAIVSCHSYIFDFLSWYFFRL